MKLLLLQPPIQDFYDTDVRLQPIGLAYLKAAVRKYLPQVDVKVLDFHRGWGRKTIAIPKELHYLKPYYPYRDKSPFSTFHQYFHFGADFETIAAQVAAEQPDVIGISSLFSPYYREVLKTVEAIRRQCDAPMILGGSHVSAQPIAMLEHPEVDFVIRGEGERPLIALLEKFLQRTRSDETPDWKGIPNLGWKDRGALIFNDSEDNFPLEDLPPPDLSDFPLEHYRYEGKPLAFLVTSRSCPHRCSFCSVHQTFGTVYRRNPIDRVFEEIQLRYQQGYRVLDFEDDNLTFYREEMKALCERLIAAFPEGELQLLAMNGISYLSLDPELLRLMKRAGFTHLNLALVTSDTTVREATKRPHTVAKYLEVVEQAFALGLKVVSYQILGLPQESLDSMVQTMCFAARLPVLLGASPFYMTPNSPIAKSLGHEAKPEDTFKARLSAMAIESVGFSRDQIYTLFVTTRILDFLKAWQDSGTEDLEISALLDRAEDPQIPEKTRLGLSLLREILETGILWAWTPQGKKPLTRFNYSLFEKVWSQLRWIGTQEDRRILISNPVAYDDEDLGIPTCRLRAPGDLEPAVQGTGL